MAMIHFILQGKGGVGKSLVASLLAQYLQGRGLQVHCFDTDPINATLAGYEALDAVALDIMNGDDIDPRRFDQLMDAIIELPSDAHVVVDNGASSFVPLGSYLLENQALEVLEDHSHSVMLHTVVTGGQAILDTLSGLKSLVSHFPATPIVVWLNRYFGDIAIDGKRFEEFKIYSECASSFHAIISLPHRKQTTFGRDLEELFARRQTFTEAQGSALPIMVRQRLTSFWRDTMTEIDQARLY
jgi:DNA polymerase III delta prime subunit